MNIYINAPFRKENLELIKKSATGCCFVEDPNDADIFIGEPTSKLSGGRLKFLQLPFAGVEKYCGDFIDEKVVIANATGAFGEIISEYIIAAILTIYREFFVYKNQQGNHKWFDLKREKMIFGSRVLILGCGNIGSSTAEKLKVFGATVAGIRRNPKSTKFFDEVYSLDKIENQLPLAEIVICCLPLTPLTNKILNKSRLEMLKENSLLINVGRGALIDEDALIDILKSGKINAVLDVFQNEPLPEKSELWNLPNVFVTPHISGKSFSHSERTERLIAEICAENVSRFVTGKELKNVINRNLGYVESK